MQRVQHRHQHRGRGHQREEREHDAREANRQLDLARHIAKPGGVQLDERLGEHDARDARPRRTIRRSTLMTLEARRQAAALSPVASDAA